LFFEASNMTVLPLLAVGLLMKFVAVVFVLVCLVLILVVLMQKGRGGGLSGAFGGGMASGLLGSKTGDFLTWVTIVLVTVFLFLAVLMARFYRPSTTYGHTAPATTRQPQPMRPSTGQTATPPAPASEQPASTAPSATPSSDAAQPAAPAAQPPAPQPAPSGTGAQPTPDTGKSGG
jgi:preprotein translocase subunit SecG